MTLATPLQSSAERGEHRAMKALVALTIAASLAAGPRAQAQAKLPRSTEAALAYAIAEHNQLGLIEYCVSAGFISKDAALRQRNVLANIAKAPENKLGDDEEAAGRKGIIAFEQSRISLAEDAAAQGISVAYSCFQLALRVLGQQPP
jgi:hypothetical protein